LPDANGGNDADAEVKQPRLPGVRSIWDIRQIKRYFEKRKAKYKDKKAADRAARRTANATVWIAAFTVILAVVGSITLYEVIEGGATPLNWLKRL
jgi:hypothetical protein